MTMTDPVAERTWRRYEYAKQRGHIDYTQTAWVNEGMYLGGGRQWSPEDREVLAEEGRPAFEFNQIMPKINTALGYQIANRMDIGYRPRRGEATQELATTLSKVAMQIADNNKLHWLESQVFSDGLIQQRGYFEIYISYEDTLLGEVKVNVLDPLDVIPDPDAKSYDPDDWGDVIITKWLTLDEIEALYGTEARNEVEQSKAGADTDFGDDDDATPRNRFGDSNTAFTDLGSETDVDGVKRYRVIDRQYWEMTKTDVLITLTGDIRVIAGMSEARVEAMKRDGAIQTKRRVRRVKWVVCTRSVVLHDDWSPFLHFTVVPFFPIFRRGLTRGLVDNAIGPQQMLNKSLSQFVHIISTTANSGWISWADTLENMDEEELEERGAETGLNIVLRKDVPVDKRPQKITPNQVPTGLDRIVDRSALLLEQATGINESMSGASGPEVSGIAIQSKQFAAQQQLALPLDNLARTRAMVGQRILELVQAYYDDPRIIRIRKTDERGQEQTEDLPINYPSEEGVLNDLTLGEYDVVITEVPQQITFENSQFMQIMEMIEKGAPIPWPFVIRYSNLAQKQEIIEALEKQQQAQPDPLTEARIALLKAQSVKTNNEAVNKAVESLYSAIQTAGPITLNPAIAPLADTLLKSAGFEDQDAAPIVPEASASPGITAPVAPRNTNPLTPANPGVGLTAGIETPTIEGVPQ